MRRACWPSGEPTYTRKIIQHLDHGSAQYALRRHLPPLIQTEQIRMTIPEKHAPCSAVTAAGNITQSPRRLVGGLDTCAAFARRARSREVDAEN